MSSENQPGLPRNADRLRTQAQKRLRTGELPAGEDVRTWGGRGSGCKCLVCDAPILEQETEFEVEVHDLLVPNGARTARLHRGCYTIWDQERLHVLAQRRRSASGQDQSGDGGPASPT
jgi:hypothetical protein